MKTGEIEVEIEGMTPLLMDKMNIEDLKNRAVKKKAITYNAEEMAEKKAYKLKNGELYIPNDCIRATILNGGKDFKIGRRNLSTSLAGAIRIEPIELKLGTKKYEIDERTAVNAGNRVLIARPMLREWKVKFKIIYYKDFLPEPEVLKDVINSAGVKVGVLNYRPQKNGSFGTFTVSKFKVMS